MKNLQENMLLLSVSLLLLVCIGPLKTRASQGCPFDDGSCQEYCSQQGCNMGYCGHFAWIQCICRKCGDEWSQYDKVSFHPDKMVNQTELDSLKLNATLSTTTTSAPATTSVKPDLSSTTVTNKESASTLTLLLIPDLSNDNGKIDLNDIPDENSERFFDYLAKNHDKLVEAASSAARITSRQMGEDSDEDVELSKQQTDSTNNDDNDLVEIQISSSDNNSKQTGQLRQQQQVRTTSAGSQKQPVASPISRLLKMSLNEANFDEMN